MTEPAKTATCNPITKPLLNIRMMWVPADNRLELGFSLDDKHRPHDSVNVCRHPIPARAYTDTRTNRNPQFGASGSSAISPSTSTVQDSPPASVNNAKFFPRHLSDVETNPWRWSATYSCSSSRSNHAELSIRVSAERNAFVSSCGCRAMGDTCVPGLPQPNFERSSFSS